MRACLASDGQPKVNPSGGEKEIHLPRLRMANRAFTLAFPSGVVHLKVPMMDMVMKAEHALFQGKGRGSHFVSVNCRLSQCNHNCSLPVTRPDAQLSTYHVTTTSGRGGRYESGDTAAVSFGVWFHSVRMLT